MLESYKYKCACFVNLADSYAIDGRLLGKSISFRYRGSYLTITIPSLIKRGQRIPTLGISGLLEIYGSDEQDWGEVKSYNDLDKPETVDAWVSKVLVVCAAKEKESLLTHDSIQNLASRLVYVLQIINPDAIRVPEEKASNVLCKVNHEILIDENGNRHTNLLVGINRVTRDGQLTLRDIKLGIKNANKSITAPYEMLGNARLNLFLQDTRAAVLNCATSIEVMLHKKVLDYFESKNTPSELQEYIFKQANGFSKL